MSLSSVNTDNNLIVCSSGSSSISGGSTTTTTSHSNVVCTSTQTIGINQSCSSIISSSYLPPSSSVTSNTSLNNKLNLLNSTNLIKQDWFEYIYKIDNIQDIIRSHEHTQNFIQSPIFQFKTHILPLTKHNSNWRLIFYPNGAGLDCKNFLSIFLKYLSDEPCKIQMMFSIVNNLNEDVYVKYTCNKFNKSNDWGFKQLIHKNAILNQQDKFLKSGTLSIRVKMRLEEHKNEYLKKLNDNVHYCKLLSENFSQFIQQQQQQHQQEKEEKEQKKQESTTNNDDLLLVESSSFNNNNNNYYDCLLIVKNNVDLVNKNPKKRQLSIDDNDNCEPPIKKNNNTSIHLNTSTNELGDSNDEFIEFRAHKCILAARSPVFKAMFNYNLKENQTNRVYIQDFKAEVIKLMLKYIYTAYLPDDYLLDAHDLYIAAEKYFIESLKFKVREYLCDNLCLDNVLQTYILSELYNDSMLKRSSLKLISEQSDKLIQTQDWDDFIKLYPQFFSNAFNSVCKKDF